MSKDNKHTDDEIEAFANEQLDLVMMHRDQLLKNIAEFHEAKCVAPEAARKNCTISFTATFLQLLDQMFYDREMRKAKLN